MCYNGVKVPCLNNSAIPPDWDVAVIDCLMEHEAYHRDSANVFCPDCAIGPSKFAPDTKGQEECEAYNAQLDCLASMSDQLGRTGWTKSWADALNYIAYLRDEKGIECPSPYI